MKFQIPQFIEVEDKIFGPLSIKQFIYLAGGAGLSVLFYIFMPSLYLAIPLIIPSLGLGLALAFYKVNNKPFIFFMENAIRYVLNPKLYIWRHQDPPVTPEQHLEKYESLPVIPKLSSNKLSDVNWTLNVGPTQHGAQNDDEEGK
jgi:hypothetical protein